MKSANPKTTPWSQKPVTNGTMLGAMVGAVLGYGILAPLIAYVILFAWRSI